MHVTGTLIKNYFHCKRQAYLYYYGLNFHNALIKIGQVMHAEQDVNELVFEKIKVDDIRDNTLIEFKKTSANLKGTRFQVLYYLDYFHSKGIMISAVIKDLTYDEEYPVFLNNESKGELDSVIFEIKNLIKSPTAPLRLKLKKNCKGCSFFDYCWLE